MNRIPKVSICIDSYYYAMYLDTKQRLIRDMLISKGTATSTLISPREVFIEAVRYRAASLILVHNHPSGDPTPSREDCFLTKRMQEAGNLLGIRLLDHIVIGDQTYCSFKREGMLEWSPNTTAIS